MKKLLQEISKCTVCTPHLALGPRPVFTAGIDSKIVIVGQAPGVAVHKSGIPWNDPSGDNLRKWMDVDKEVFYDTSKISLIPMGLCYPGKGKTGDLPPRKECAPLWHQALLSQMKNVRLTLLVGKYAQDYYLQKQTEKNLTNTVKNFQRYLPNYFVLPHPSPRNNIWQAKNQWFKERVVPELQLAVHKVLEGRQ